MEEDVGGRAPRDVRPSNVGTQPRTTRWPGGNRGHAGSPEVPEGEAEMTRYYFSNCSDPQSERLTASSVGQNLGQVGNS